MRRNEFLLTPGPLPWRVDCMTRNPKSGVVYDADGRLVCVAAIGNAREIVRMANLFKDCEVAKRESPAGGVQSQVPRNGEAEAVANAVGRESVAQGRTRSNTAKQSSARPAPTAPTGTELRRESGTPCAKVTGTENGPSNCTAARPARRPEKPGTL